MPNEHSQTTVVVHLRSFVNSLFFAQLVDILNRRGTLTLIARILLSVASRSRAVSVARGGVRGCVMGCVSGGFISGLPAGRDTQSIAVPSYRSGLRQIAGRAVPPALLMPSHVAIFEPAHWAAGVSAAWVVAAVGFSFP